MNVYYVAGIPVGDELYHDMINKKWSLGRFQGNADCVSIIPTSNELYHHGILGMHWGIRRFQNKDGSYTEAGKKHRAEIREDLDYSHLSKDKKIKKESEIVTRPKSGRYLDERTVEVAKAIKANAGKSKMEQETGRELQKARKEMERAATPDEFMMALKKVNDLEYTLSSYALDNIGYEDTEQAREFAYQVLFGDENH